MPSPYRDPERPGGWVPWRERLLPLLAVPGEWVDFPMSSVNVAKGVACHLRKKRRPIPPGRWEFKAHHSTLRARFLG